MLYEGGALNHCIAHNLSDMNATMMGGGVVQLFTIYRYRFYQGRYHTIIFHE